MCYFGSGSFKDRRASISLIMHRKQDTVVIAATPGNYGAAVAPGFPEASNALSFRKYTIRGKLDNPKY